MRFQDAKAYIYIYMNDSIPPSLKEGLVTDDVKYFKPRSSVAFLYSFREVFVEFGVVAPRPILPQRSRVPQNPNLNPLPIRRIFVECSYGLLGSGGPTPPTVHVLLRSSSVHRGQFWPNLLEGRSSV